VSRRAAIPIVSCASFLAGFGIAELTGVRALGVSSCSPGARGARAALQVAGPPATVALVVIALAMFVASHPLGHAIGAWPAVVVCAALLGGAAAALLGRRRGGPTAVEA
jgi:hypothetical protein